MIKNYGVEKLAKKPNFDKEIIYSIYTDGRKKGAHSIQHLLKISNLLGYNLYKLEKEITFYGLIQMNMCSINFPFILTPLHVRATSIHDD